MGNCSRGLSTGVPRHNSDALCLQQFTFDDLAPGSDINQTHVAPAEALLGSALPLLLFSS